VRDIKFLAKAFKSCSFKHVGRSLNKVAHVLARSCDSESCNFYFSVVPAAVRKELCNDVM
jgi:hypothetical protein